MTDKIALNIAGETKELVLRQGEAEKITYPKAVNITGILAAPYQYYSGRKELCPADKSHLEIDNKQWAITLVVLDTDPHSTQTIVGKLVSDKYFAEWAINTEKRWSVQAFLRHIQMQKPFFTERGECDEMVKSLRTWSANIETVIKEHNSTSGNSLSMLERKVSGIELKTKFKLTIPIFQGYPKQTFTVEIGLDPKSTQVDLYLFSSELFSLAIDYSDAIIMDELAKFDEFPCSKVVIS